MKTKAYTTANESSPYFCKCEIIGGANAPLAPLMSATASRPLMYNQGNFLSPVIQDLFSFSVLIVIKLFHE